MDEGSFGVDAKPSVVKKGYFTTSDKAHIYYEERGRGESSIVIVPGHMCTTKFFEKNASYFENKYKVVCMDSRGHGNSSKPLHGNSIERLADDIRELMDFLDLQNVNLIGWSLSGSIIVTYAAKYGCERLQTLGLIDCCLFPFSPEEWNTYNSKNYNMDDWNAKYMLWHTDINQYVENFISRVRNDLSESEIELVRQEIVKTPPWIGFALHSDWCHVNATALLPQIDVPAIFFGGTSLGHGFEMGRYYKNLMRMESEVHEFERGGHVLFMAESQKFNQKLEAFIEKHSNNQNH